MAPYSQAVPDTGASRSVRRSKRRETDSPFQRPTAWLRLVIVGCGVWTAGIVAVAAFGIPGLTPKTGHFQVVVQGAPLAPGADEPQAFEIFEGDRRERRADNAEQPRACAKGACAAGTRIRFIKEPTEAFQQAKREKKLVFMIHLAGNFDDPGFT